MAAQQPPVISDLARQATRQHGVVSRAQLSTIGISAQRIKTMIAHGHLIRIHRSVYAVGHVRLSARGRWLAAVLACGDGARLSHRTASALHDLRGIGSGSIHVTALTVHQVGGVRCHRTHDLGGLNETAIDGIPVTSLERTMLDEAATLSSQRLRGLLEAVQRRGRFDLRRFDEVISDANGHHGCGRLRLALTQLDDGAPILASALEAKFLALVRSADLPEPSMNVVVLGERVDAHWPTQRVIVEVDSWHYHRHRRSFEVDRRRSNTFNLAGELLLRITDQRIDHDAGGVQAEVAAALARHTGGAPTGGG